MKKTDRVAAFLKLKFGGQGGEFELRVWSLEGQGTAFVFYPVLWGADGGFSQGANRV